MLYGVYGRLVNHTNYLRHTYVQLVARCTLLYFSSMFSLKQFQDVCSSGVHVYRCTYMYIHMNIYVIVNIASAMIIKLFWEYFLVWCAHAI